MPRGKKKTNLDSRPNKRSNSRSSAFLQDPRRRHLLGAQRGEVSVHWRAWEAIEWAVVSSDVPCAFEKTTGIGE